MREILHALARRARTAPSRPAVSDGALSLDYAALAASVTATAAALRALPMPPGVPPVIGIPGGNRVEWVVAQLAIWRAGLTAVPLPPFFSDAQRRHILADAGVTHILHTQGEVARGEVAQGEMAENALDLPTLPVVLRDGSPESGPESGPDLALCDDAAQIIYTSGSTGTPKGVRLEAAQLGWSAAALARAIDARADDRYLSLLPLALLLETLCAVAVPLLVGGHVTLAPTVTAGFRGGTPVDPAAPIAAARPTCMVLVPQLLAAWVGSLEQGGVPAPDSLRLVAVGGAAVPASLAARAWKLGIPVHEGYGLSECCSVVALNRPDERRAGTVGRPLPGLAVTIDAGEIVVTGPSVMSGYLRGTPLPVLSPFPPSLTRLAVASPPVPALPVAPSRTWRTGDLGSFDDEGRLTVHGRKDNLIVTPWGRNISPEWVEAAILGDPRVGLCLLSDGGEAGLALLLVPSPLGAPWFLAAPPAAVAALVAAACADIPDYARPRRQHVSTLADIAGRGLLTGNGRLRRRETAAAYRHALHPPSSSSPPTPSPSSSPAPSSSLPLPQVAMP